MRCGTLLDENIVTLGSVAPSITREPAFRLHFPFGEIRINGILKIGRDPDFSPIAAQIETLDRVSRRHAEVKITDGKLIVVDNHSMNGVSVNGRPIDPDIPCVLRVGDQVSFSSQLQATVAEACF